MPARGPAWAPFPNTYPTPTMRTTYATALCLALAAGFWYCLTTTLDDMTRRDCQLGVQAACAALAKEAR